MSRLILSNWSSSSISIPFPMKHISVPVTQTFWDNCFNLIYWMVEFVDANGLITRLNALMDNYEESLLAARLER